MAASCEDTRTIELEMKVAEDYAKFYNHGEGPYYGLLLVGAFTFKRLIRGHSHITSAAITRQGHSREIMMGVGNRVASVIMLTFPSEPCPHADFSK